MSSQLSHHALMESQIASNGDGHQHYNDYDSPMNPPADEISALIEKD